MHAEVLSKTNAEVSMFEKEYKQKLVSADEAVKIVKSGDWVDYGWSLGTALVLDKALAKRAEELEDVKIRGGLVGHTPEVSIVDPECKHFVYHEWYTSPPGRKLVNQRQGYFMPMLYNELPLYYRRGLAKVDVAMVQVCPMDKSGYFNFGPFTSHILDVCLNAKKVIVEVNEAMPRTFGQKTDIHISQVDYVVEAGNNPLPSIEGKPPRDIDKKIAGFIVPEIGDGACLQFGIGGIPDAVGAMIAQSDLKDLGVHSELYTDAFMMIAKAGKITGARKSIDRYKQTLTFATGSTELWNFLDGNPEIYGAPVDYVNNVGVLASIDNFISINGAVEVDLFGQVNSESSGFRHISGTGGQLDFVQGAFLSNGGKSFICIASTFTDKQGVKHSNIKQSFAPGSIVTTPRSALNYLVTEYGIFNAKGKTTWERAEGFINIAHPDFRDDLIKQAEEIGIWRNSNKR